MEEKNQEPFDRNVPFEKGEMKNPLEEKPHSLRKLFEKSVSEQRKNKFQKIQLILIERRDQSEFHAHQMKISVESTLCKSKPNKIQSKLLKFNSKTNFLITIEFLP